MTSEGRSAHCLGRSSCRLAVLAPALAAISVGSAEAHEIVPGVTGFASLLLHPFVAVETALLMLGLALVVGSMGRRPPLALGMGVLLVGTSAGVLLQPSAILVPGLWHLPLILALTLGTAAAIGRAVPRSVVIALALLVATAVGIAVPPERPGLVGRAEVVAAVVSAILVTLLVIAVPRAILGHFRPVQLGGQILGAWILAISLLGMTIWFR